MNERGFLIFSLTEERECEGEMQAPTGREFQASASSNGNSLFPERKSVSVCHGVSVLGGRGRGGYVAVCVCVRACVRACVRV